MHFINIKLFLKNKAKYALLWCIGCTAVFLLSVFLHECGHGLANSINGIECSTGFNRVGDIYKYPKDINFREEYSRAAESLVDFGVPITLLLAIVGTLLFYKSVSKTVRIIALQFGAVNSLIRLIPCLYVVLTPLLTGRIHKEDEYGTGSTIS